MVSEAVIDLFEAIQVQHGDYGGPALTVQVLDAACRLPHEFGPVWQSGQVINRRLALQSRERPRHTKHERPSEQAGQGKDLGDARVLLRVLCREFLHEILAWRMNPDQPGGAIANRERPEHPEIPLLSNLKRTH